MTTQITAKRSDFRGRIAPALMRLLQGRSDCSCAQNNDSISVWRPKMPRNVIHLDLTSSDRFKITWPLHGGPRRINAIFDEVSGRYVDGTDQQLLREILDELARPLR